MSFPSLAPLLAGGLSLLLSIWLLCADNTSVSLQSELQHKQDSVQAQQQRVRALQQTAQTQAAQLQDEKMLHEQAIPILQTAIGQRIHANQNEKLRALLSRYGIPIPETPAPAPAAGEPAVKPPDEKPATAPAATPAPAKAATPNPHSSRLTVPR